MLETLPILGIHTIMQLFTPLVVALAVTVPPTVAEVEVEVADQVDLSLVVLLDLIKIEVVEEVAEETPTTDLIK